MSASGPEPGSEADTPVAASSTAPDDPYALGENPTVVEQLWVVTRIIIATLLILLGFALAVGIVFRLT